MLRLIDVFFFLVILLLLLLYNFISINYTMILYCVIQNICIVNTSFAEFACNKIIYYYCTLRFFPRLRFSTKINELPIV